ncbi:YlbL family protein [Phycicoccus duodecadis]|uniref:PDZ domain-containing protein n=1 Tax=Phycicoccus duodecadis TaxID=173053 RepID=A0A2N3YGZ2_9MICO|nr:PDZ domain-containing protein [Phycicoccus duodecadis]PKW26104.1 PDZ domain-containing protein [Phycicoccus duodecadis]
MSGLPDEDLRLEHAHPGDTAHDDPWRPGRLAAGALTAVFVLVILAAGMTFVGLPYVVLSPGPATNVLGDVGGKPVLSVSGAQTYPTDGALDFTTVGFDGGPGRTVTIYDLAEAWLSDDIAVEPEKLYFPPDVSEDDVAAQNTEMMNESQVVAAATALRALGRTVKTTVGIAGVPQGSPAQGVIETGDVIVSVDGTPATDPAAVRAAVTAHQPGEDVRVTVRRGGVEKTLTVKAGDSQGRAVIGVLLRTDYDLPVEVTLNTGQVGGPSAGLMFSLAIYDVLTPGALTGGKRIAGTGTIEDDGSVGAISGIQQKMVGAHAVGARWFLSPAEDCADAVGHVPDGMTLLKVTTFTDAKAAVEGIAKGDTAGLPRCG